MSGRRKLEDIFSQRNIKLFLKNSLDDLNASIRTVISKFFSKQDTLFVRILLATSFFAVLLQYTILFVENKIATHSQISVNILIILRNIIRFSVDDTIYHSMEHFVIAGIMVQITKHSGILFKYG